MSDPMNDMPFPDEVSPASAKKSGISKKKSPKNRNRTSLGSLPDSIDDVKKVTTDTGEDTARSLLDVMPAQTTSMFGQANFGPPTMGGAVLVPPPLMGGGSGSRSKSAGPSTVTVPTHWNLTDEHVKALPEFHPLERTAVFVPHSSASTVARRISDVLRSRSVSAEFVNSKAKAKCLTSDNVDFRIRLYRGKNKFSHGIIAEVQRRYGFSTTFHSDVTAILDGAEGKAAKQQPSSPSSAPSLVPAEEDVLPQDSDLVSLKIASDMLSPATSAAGGLNANLDRRAMGLDGLASLTDPYKVGRATATRASTEILSGKHSAIRDAVLDLVLRPKTASTPAVDSLDLAAASEDEDEIRMLRPRAMIVLSNVFANLSGTDSLLALKPIVSQAIVPALLRDVKTALTDPRGADLAVRTLLPIIETLGDDDGFVGTDLIGQGAYELLIESQAVGEVRFDSLREHSGLCLRALDSR